MNTGCKKEQKIYHELHELTHPSIPSLMYKRGEVPENSGTGRVRRSQKWIK
jgi:hypothetical protein